MSPETEAQLLQDMGAVKANVETLLKHAERHDKRVTSIERKMWWSSGAVGAIAAVIVPKVRAVFGV